MVLLLVVAVVSIGMWFHHTVIGRYLVYLLQHKWFVLLEGRALIEPCGWWQLLVHDSSKFSRVEFMPYAVHFYARTPHGKRRNDPAFRDAHEHHLRVNKHHWEYWTIRPEGTEMYHIAHKMPYRFVQEMAADWRAMARFHGNPSWKWYSEHRDTIMLHPVSRAEVEELIGYVHPFEAPYGVCSGCPDGWCSGCAPIPPDIYKPVATQLLLTDGTKE